MESVGFRVFYMREDDRKRVLELAEQEFGPNYLLPEHFDESKFVAAIDYESSGVVGYGSCRIKEEVFSWVGEISEVVVDPNHQRKGVGTEIVKVLLTELKRLGATCAVAQAWYRWDNKTIPAKKILEANGFEQGELLEGYYYDPESDYECVICGKPCQCDAYLFTLNFK